MENHRLKSKLTENDKEFLIQTDSDINRNRISSSVYIDGDLVEKVEFPHPDDYKTAEVMGLLKKKHQEKKREVENLLLAYYPPLPLMKLNVKRISDGGPYGFVTRSGNAVR